MATLRLVQSGHIYGCLTQNVLHFNKSDLTQAEMLTLAQRWRDNGITNFGIFVLSNHVFENIKVTVPSQPSWPAVELPIAIAGYAGYSVYSTSMLCMVIKVNTAINNRHGRGRIYWPGAGPGGLEYGNWAASVQGNFSTAATSFIGKWGPTGTELFEFGVCARNDPETFYGATSLVLRASCGVQRRRNIGVGA